MTYGRGDPEVLVGTDEVSGVIFAVGQIEERPGRGLEALALGELGARGGPVPRLRRLASVAEGRLGIGGARAGRRARAEERRQEKPGEASRAHQNRWS